MRSVASIRLSPYDSNMGDVLGALLQNETLSSNIGSYAVFDINPFTSGGRLCAFKGIVSEIPKRKYVIKVFRNKHFDGNTSKQRFDRYLQSVKIACKLSEQFGDKNIRFIEIRSAEMDSVSPLTTLIKSSDGRQKRRLSSDDTVVIEENLGHAFITFIDRDGTVGANCPENLQEFVHFIYKESRGEQIVTGLKGILFRQKQILKLTSPTFHSVAKTCGPDDIGERAVLNFFTSHKCTKMCSQWPKPVVQHPFHDQIKMDIPFSCLDNSPVSSFMDLPPSYDACVPEDGSFHSHTCSVNSCRFNDDAPPPYDLYWPHSPSSLYQTRPIPSAPPQDGIVT